MFCENCGNQVSSDDKFCRKCGKPIKALISKEIEEKSMKAKKSDAKDMSFANKFKLPIIIVVVVIIVLIIVHFVVFKVDNNKPHFEAEGGYKTFYVNGDIVRDELVEYKGKEYYIDGDGHMVTDSFEMVNNNGDLGFFGSKGERVYNAIKEVNGLLYYIDSNGILFKGGNFDFNGNTYHTNSDGTIIVSAWIDDKYLGEDGREVKNDWVGDYYLGEDGKIVKNKWVGDYYLGSDGKYVRNGYTGDGKYVGADGKITEAPKMTQAAPVAPTTSAAPVAPVVPATTQRATQNAGGNTSTEVVEPSTANHDGAELYIIDTGTIKEEYETKGGNSCKVTVIRPTVAGVNLDEGDIFNDGVGEAIDQLLEELEEFVGNSSTEYKTITFTKAEMTTLTSSRARITLSGKIYPKSGSSKTIKYRITYNREEETCELEKINS